MEGFEGVAKKKKQGSGVKEKGCEEKSRSKVEKSSTNGVWIAVPMDSKAKDQNMAFDPAALS